MQLALEFEKTKQDMSPVAGGVDAAMQPIDIHSPTLGSTPGGSPDRVVPPVSFGPAGGAGVAAADLRPLMQALERMETNIRRLEKKQDEMAASLKGATPGW